MTTITKNNSFQIYLRIAVAALVLVSKNIIIVNEETLVALSFLLFVIFCYTKLSSNIEESFDSRSNSIREEVQFSLNKKHDNLQNLLAYYKTQVDISKNLQGLYTANVSKITYLRLLRNLEGEHIVANEFVNKLKVLSLMLSNFSSSIQVNVTKALRGTVLDKYKANDVENNKLLFNQSLALLKEQSIAKNN